MQTEEGLLLRDSFKSQTTPPFCDCYFPDHNNILNSTNLHDFGKCNCVEKGHLNKHREWTWHQPPATSNLYINGNDVIFNPVFSYGTAFVRGEKRLKTQMIHYWEIQIITDRLGTDNMYGIGTDALNFDAYRDKYVSGLGQTKQSWGFSYRGLKMHNGLALQYGKRVTQGCVVGIYLDLCHGYLEFYLNRKSLGIAFKNIPCDPYINLYPMACSTSSRCAIRLLNSTSHPLTLQFRTMFVVAKRYYQLNQLEKYSSFKPLLNDFWFLIPSTKYSHRSKKNELPLDDEVVLSKRAKKLAYQEDEQSENEDIYENVVKTPAIKSNEHNDEDTINSDMFMLL